MLKTVRIIHGTAALVFLMGYAMHLSAQARVTRIVIDEVKALSSDQSGGIQTEQIAGRAYGEIDPQNAANRIINDVMLARDPDGKVRYVATFVLTKQIGRAHV